MNKFITLAAIAMLSAGSFATHRFISTQDGAAAGEAVAEAHEMFAKREAARIAEANAALEAKRQLELEQQHNREAHDAIWNEIARLQKEDKQ